MASPPGDLDAAAVADALDVLEDLVRWRMPAKDWDAIETSLAEMRTAVAGGRSPELVNATTYLEMVGPPRRTDLGAVPTIPPPPTVHLIRNHLVHALGGVAQSSTVETAPVAAAGSDAVMQSLATQYLVVHVFAADSGPAAGDAERRIRELWAACETGFGAVYPIEALGLPTELPDGPFGDAAVAARRDANASVQAIVHHHHDALVLSFSAKAPDVTWAQWARRWSAAGAGDDTPLLGVVTIFAGTVDTPPDAATVRGLSGVLPPTLDPFWQADGTALPGCVLWQLPPPGDGRRRRLVVLAHDTDRDVLSGLVWSRGGNPVLTPFTHYLLNAAKARYARRVRDVSMPMLDGDPDGGIFLEALADTAKIARTNMSRALGAAGVVTDPAAGPLADDLAAVDALLEQLGYDRRHLERTLTRAAARSPVRRSVAERPSPTFGLITALPEEHAAMRALLDDPVRWPVEGDRADYTRGTIPSNDPGQPHEVVLTMLTETGTDAAAHGEANLVRSFSTVDQLVMVGIAAGVPAPHDPARHVRLGDVVAGTWNVVDFDHVVDRPTGRQRRQEFPRRSALLAGAAKRLTADELHGERPWDMALDRLLRALPAFAPPHPGSDVLFSDDTDVARVVKHPDPALSGHRTGRPKIHEGRIGSSDRSLRNAAQRDALAREHNLRAIEMEGKGVGRAAHSDGRDWFVVRGISDYGDRWLDETWRPFAAAVAAAYVRALLGACPPIGPHGGRTGGVPPG